MVGAAAAHDIAVAEQEAAAGDVRSVRAVLVRGRLVDERLAWCRIKPSSGTHPVDVDSKFSMQSS